jgi:hypothetical protein
VKKILEILTKLGLLKYGSASGTFKNAAEEPSDFEYMNMSRKKDSAVKDNNDNSQNTQEHSKVISSDCGAPLWMVVASWVLGALFWLVALDAFSGDDYLAGFWLVLAGLVTVHHTNKLLGMIGVDLSSMWRVVVVVVSLLAAIVDLSRV